MQEYEQAVISYNQALQVKNDYTDAWNNRGVALSKLQKYEAAIASYDNAAKIRPDFYRIWYNKARCYALQGKIELAIENLKRAFNLNPNVCKELAKSEADLEKIREHDAFKQLINWSELSRVSGKIPTAYSRFMKYRDKGFRLFPTGIER